MELKNSDSKSKKHRNILTILIKWVVALILIYILFQSGRLDYNYLLQTRIGWPLVGILIGQGLMLIVPLVRWYLLVRSRDFKLGFGKAIRIGFMGYFTMLYIPAGLGIEGIRILYLSRENKGRGQDALSTVIMDRILGLIALLILSVFFGAILLWLKSDPLINKMLLISTSFLGFLIAILALLFNAQVFKILHSSWLRKWFGEIIQAMHVYRYNKTTLILGLLLSLIGHMGNFLSAYFALISMDFPVLFIGLLTVTPLITLSQAIPLTPLGLGVTDGMASILYPVVGLQGGAEVIMLLRVIGVFIFTFCGLSFFQPRRFIISLSYYLKSLLVVVFNRNKKSMVAREGKKTQ